MSSELTPPLFSIIIPTKNRAKYLETALVSIRDQSYNFYELIVVDNDDSNETYELCKKITNPRMRYFRTGSLNMFDNWNYGVDHSRGSWIIFLEDKQALFRDSLAVLAKTIANHKIDTALVYGGDFYNDEQFEAFGLVKRKSYTGEVRYIESKLLISEYERNLIATSGRVDMSIFIPMPQHSVINRNLLEKTKDEFGEYFTFGALDVTSALAKLLLCEGIYRIDLGLYLITTMKVSNGLNAAIYREKEHENIMPIATGEFKSELTNLPFPEISMTNVFVVDYLVLMKKNDSNFFYNLDLIEYFKCIFRDIYNIHAVKRGVPLSNSIKKYFYYLGLYNLYFTQKLKVYIFIVKHYIFLHLFLIALNTKHWLDNFIVKKGEKYKNPHDYISKIDLSSYLR